LNVGHFRESLEYIESLGKMKEEREEKIQVELESLEKMREEREVKLQIEWETMLDKKI